MWDQLFDHDLDLKDSFWREKICNILRVLLITELEFFLVEFQYAVCIFIPAWQWTHITYKDDSCFKMSFSLYEYTHAYLRNTVNFRFPSVYKSYIYIIDYRLLHVQ